jgi:hypothetical protein
MEKAAARACTVRLETPWDLLLPLPGGSAAAMLPDRPGVDEATIQAAIDRLTRALATAADDAIPRLVDERRALREELGELARGRRGR